MGYVAGIFINRMDVIFLLLIIVIFMSVGLAVVKLYREIFFFEGIRFGTNFNRWLYDRWSANYDKYKRKVQKDDGRLLIEPLVELMSQNGLLTFKTVVLDIGTGTGRLPAALLENKNFTGKIIALDISEGMLRKAKEKLSIYGNRVVLINSTAMTLPFPDNSIDVLSCLETIELLPNNMLHLKEFFRVLIPGGILLLSRNTGEWGIKGSVCTPDIFAHNLIVAGFENIIIKPWWKWFDIVWAFKPKTTLKL